LNTNADTIASELAIALSALFDVTLSYCFEKSGVLRDSEDDTSVIATMNAELYSEIKRRESDPFRNDSKLDNCFNSLSRGVQKNTNRPPQHVAK
jgi:acetylglutamate kinase